MPSGVPGVRAPEICVRRRVEIVQGRGIPEHCWVFLSGVRAIPAASARTVLWGAGGGMEPAVAVAALQSAGVEVEALKRAIADAMFLMDTPGDDRQKLRGPQQQWLR